MGSHFKFPAFALALALAVCPAAAFAAKSPLGGKHNNKAPVEVTSDTLEVLQQENKATFSGHVVAIQGKVRLTADKMTVYYTGAEDMKGKGAASGRKEEAAQGAVKKIEATGSVFLSTPQETASGASGLYDVLNQEIHLNGSVVLTRGKNVLKGDTLTYNFASGRSVVSGLASGDAKAGGNGRERVRALFVPESSKGKVVDGAQ